MASRLLLLCTILSLAAICYATPPVVTKAYARGFSFVLPEGDSSMTLNLGMFEVFFDQPIFVGGIPIDAIKRGLVAPGDRDGPPPEPLMLFKSLKMVCPGGAIETQLPKNKRDGGDGPPRILMPQPSGDDPLFTTFIQMSGVPDASVTLLNNKMVVALILSAEMDGMFHNFRPLVNSSTVHKCSLFFNRTIITNAANESVPAYTNFTAHPPIPCNAEAFAYTADKLIAAINNMKVASSPEELSSYQLMLIAYTTSANYSSCRKVFTDLLSFNKTAFQKWSKACTLDRMDQNNPGSINPDWASDPCCNWEASRTKCCAGSYKTYFVDQLTDMNSSWIHDHCVNSDINERVLLDFYNELLRVTDPQTGCDAVWKQTANRQNLESLRNFRGECYTEIFGTTGSGKECTSDTDCYTSCGFDGKCVVPWGDPTPSMLRCYLDKMNPRLLKFLYVYFNKSSSAPLSEIEPLFTQLNSENDCKGPFAWKYSSRWSERGWVPGNETGCLSERSCNYGPFLSQAECDQKTGNFCAQCYGPHCNDRTLQPTCELRMYPMDESLCAQKGGTVEQYPDRPMKRCILPYNNQQDCIAATNSSENFWTWWEAGQFYTKELCERGYCTTNMMMMNETECNSTFFCSVPCSKCRSNSGWSSLCVREDIDSWSECNYPFFWEPHYNVCRGGNMNPEQCANLNGTTYSCGDYTVDQCGTDSGVDETMQTFLNCNWQQHTQCDTAAECTASGFCNDWGIFNWPKQSTCIVPYLESNDFGPQCAPGSRPTQIGCATDSISSAANCTAAGGSWKTKAKNPAECADLLRMCKEPGQPWLSPKSADECALCGGYMAPMFSWTVGRWQRGKLVPLEWKARAWAPANLWGPAITERKLETFVNAVIARDLSLAFQTWALCSTSKVTDILKKLSCECTVNTTCANATAEELSLLGLGTAFAGLDSHLELGSVGIDVSAGAVEGDSADISVSSGSTLLSGNVQQARKRIAQRLTTFQYLAPVINTGGATSGYILTDRFAFDINAKLKEPLTICLPVRSDLTVDKTAFDILSLVQINGSSFTWITNNVTIDETGRICGPITSSGTYAGGYSTAAPVTATTSTGSITPTTTGSSTGAQGTTAQGTTAQGTTAQGTTAQGTTAHGTTAQGTSAQGTTAQGTTAQGTTAQGTSAQGTTAQGTTAAQGTTTAKGTSSSGNKGNTTTTLFVIVSGASQVAMSALAVLAALVVFLF